MDKSSSFTHDPHLRYAEDSAAYERARTPRHLIHKVFDGGDGELEVLRNAHVSMRTIHDDLFAQIEDGEARRSVLDRSFVVVEAWICVRT